MMSLTSLEAFKEIAGHLINLIPGGAIFATADKETVTWKLGSQTFDIPDFQVGTRVRPEGAAFQSIAQQKEVTEKIPRVVYGMRVIMNAIPVYDGDTVTQSFLVIIPRLHPIAKSFNDFAPLIANMFPEGAFLCMTDLTKIAYRHASDKFDMPDLQLGDPLREGWIADRAIKTKSLAVEEVDASVHGVPVLIMSNPCFDEDDNSKVVATFCIALPKQNAVNLRQLSSNLTSGLQEISAVIEELAASASEINTNEQELNNHIEEVNKLADKISEVLAFIKQIADETKMLGLNAAIEAARAGEAGRGFGVVAEEIRKLSDQSKETVVSIRDLITKIKTDVSETTKKSELNLHASQEQAAATEEITASVQEISSLAEQLDKIAKEI
ncbi:MAG: methyl-accepting chemotaxis protein [Syntrophomonadaceae bacterium]